MELTEIIPDDLPEWAIKAMAEGQFLNVVFEKIKDMRTKEPVFTREIDSDSGSIQMFVDDVFVVEWSYDDDPEACFDEFKEIFLAGMRYK